MDIPSIIAGTIGIMVLIIVPGLALSLALFPKKDQLDFIERLGFSFVLGLIPQLFQYFLDKNLGVPINTAITLGIIASITALGLLVWKFRQK